MKRKNPQGDLPRVHKTAFIDSTAVIIGKLIVGKNAFIGPGAVIRADEPDSSIIIGDNCNIQDRVIIHSLSGCEVVIGKNSSLAHGCIVHGPCKIGKNCFIGFGSVVFKSELADYVFVKHLAVVEGVSISSEKVVASKQLVNCADDVKKLTSVGKKDKSFMEKVVKVNLCLGKEYKK